MTDDERNDVRLVLTALEGAAVAHGEEYGYQFASKAEAVQWAMGAHGDEWTQEENAQFAAYLRLREALG